MFPCVHIPYFWVKHGFLSVLFTDVAQSKHSIKICLKNELIIHLIQKPVLSAYQVLAPCLLS